MSTRVGVFASGGGSNLKALLDRFGSGGHGEAWRPEIALVVSDRADAGALRRARQAGVAALTIPVKGIADDELASAMLAALGEARVEFVVLAGYLRRVPAAVVTAYRGRMVNVHPALLPAFGGAGMYGSRVHEAVLAAGCRVSGVTVHFVDEEYDRGPILAQWPVPVLPTDTPQRLAARVLRTEHRLLPLCVEAVARRLRGAGPRSRSESDESAFVWSGAPAPDDDSLRRGVSS